MSGTSGSSGFGSVSIEQIESSTVGERSEVRMCQLKVPQDADDSEEGTIRDKENASQKAKPQRQGDKTTRRQVEHAPWSQGPKRASCIERDW